MASVMTIHAPAVAYAGVHNWPCMGSGSTGFRGLRVEEQALISDVGCTVPCRLPAHNMAAAHGLAFPEQPLTQHGAAHCSDGRRIPGEDRRQARCNKLALVHAQAADHVSIGMSGVATTCLALQSLTEGASVITFRLNVWSGDEMYADLNGWRLYLRDMKADGGKTMAQVRLLTVIGLNTCPDLVCLHLRTSSAAGSFQYRHITPLRVNSGASQCIYMVEN